MNIEVMRYTTEKIDENRIPRTPFDYPRAWDRRILRATDFMFPIPKDCLRELDDVVTTLRRDPLPTLMLRPEMFALDACHRLMTQVKGTLNNGVGFAVIDRLPMESLSRDEAIALYWLLGSLVAPPVAQKWNGLMIYDVRDIGNKHGIGVRGSTTNAELNFHTDNSYARMPPFIVGLLCCQVAREGGQSRLLSWRSVFNVLLDQYPHLVTRAFREFLYDRNNEHVAGAPRVMSKAPFAIKGDDIEVRFSPNGIPDGYEMTGTVIDDEGQELLDAIRDISSNRELWAELNFAPGQIQLINNHVVGHARTGFTDYPEPERKRHLVRLWFRDKGRPSYDG